MVSSGVKARANPFVERGRITDAEHFIGRWRELSVIFDRLEQNRPILVAGMPGVGKSSLLTHVVQSAAVNLEDPELRALYVDLRVLPNAAACYELVVRALGSRGDTSAAVEVALLETDGPVLLGLDSVESAIAAGWGETLLESLARTARHSKLQAVGAIQPDEKHGLFLVAAVRSPAPTLSEPFVNVTLGALAATEMRLLADTYLHDADVQFTSQDLRDLNALSGGHPAYFQRGAYHLFIAKTQPEYDWRAAYLAEAQDQPVPDAPLPPGIFESDAATTPQSSYGELDGNSAAAARPAGPHVEGQGSLVAALVLIVAALLALQISGSWLLALGVLGVGIALIVLLERR